jgi:hypothetical protein
VALACLSYIVGLPRGDANAVHADETGKWIKIETPLKVFNHKSYASVEGFWQSTSSSKDRQMAFPVAVSITCTRNNMTCTESQATVVLGFLKPDLVEYGISGWTEDVIAADSDGNCGVGHRLSLDFKSNSVTVTDYPTKVLGGDCKAFQDANSYVLHGGGLMLSPTAEWNPLSKPEGKK